MITHSKAFRATVVCGAFLFAAACGSPDSVAPTPVVPSGPSPVAAAASFDLLKNGRGAPLDVATVVSAVDAGEGASLTAISFPETTDQGGSLELDEQGVTDFNQHIIRYTPATDVGAVDSFEYTVTNSNGQQDTETVTINLTDPAACDAEVDKRKASGLGWCFETYFDSFDIGADGDGTGTNIAIQVFIPHPWHQRLNALDSGATLTATDRGFSPLLIHSHGFGGNKEEDFQDPETYLDNQVAKAAWEDGYNVISYTQRGFGGTPATQGDDVPSGDSIGILAPNLEGFDFIRLVDWAICHLRVDAPLEAASDAENHEVDVNGCASDFNGAGNWGASMLSVDGGGRLTGYDDDVAIATVGYSYGGGFQFLAQSVDERVDAIMPMGTWHDLRFSLHPHDTPKFTWIEIMNQFAGTTPGLGGGNGEPLPTVLTAARTESNGANAQTDDQPHNKDHQVSVSNARILGSKGPVAWCYDNQNYYATKYADPDGDPESLEAATPANTPAHLNVTTRAPRANLFMIQGYGDTLFNFNEGYDNARCFEDAGIEDVRMLHQISGHPFPTVPGLVPEDAIPPHYAGSDTSMYLDEVVHCGVDGNGDPVRYNMVEVLKQWTDFHLRGLLADGLVSADDIFPTNCITQPNADPDLTLREDDPFYNGTNAAATGYKFSREGVVFDSVASTPLGHSHYSQPDMAQTNTDGNFDIPETTVTTGLTAAGSPQISPAELYVASNPNGEVLAGIPLVHVEVSRANPIVDDIVYAGVYVKRCQLDPKDTTFDGGGAPDNCNDANPEELLHFQAAPIRVFPASAAETPPPSDAAFPKLNPRNFVGNNSLGGHYPLGAGYNPQTMRGAGTALIESSSLASPQGRLLGVSARLYPGDKVGLAFYPGHLAFATMAAATASQVTLTGTAQLPLVDTAARTDAPTNIPSYVENSAP